MTFGETVVAVTNISHSSSSSGSVTLFTCPAGRYAHVSVAVIGATGSTTGLFAGGTRVFSRLTNSDETFQATFFVGPGQSVSYDSGGSGARSASGVALQFNLP